MSEVIIEIENLSQSFGENKVFENVNLKIEKGKIIGIIGYNGSGKSVLFKLICGLLPVKSGSIKVRGLKLGEDISIPDKLGVIIETPGFLPYLTGYENLKQLASIRNEIGPERICESLELVGLDPDNPAKVSGYSLGMRQRLGIAQAIMEYPDILILDEPFNGLDKNGSRAIRDFIGSLSEKGVTILMASHYPDDINILADEIYEFNNGRLSAAEKLER